jgi:hypothetical protein
MYLKMIQKSSIKGGRHLMPVSLNCFAGPFGKLAAQSTSGIEEWVQSHAFHGIGDESMTPQTSNVARTDTPVSDRTLRSIVEQGFFGAPGSLADARAACAELLFAREIIKAQTSRIAQLDSGGA